MSKMCCPRLERGSFPQSLAVALASAHRVTLAGPWLVVYQGCTFPPTKRRAALTAAHCWTLLLPLLFQQKHLGICVTNWDYYLT